MARTALALAAMTLVTGVGIAPVFAQNNWYYGGANGYLQMAPRAQAPSAWGQPRSVPQILSNGVRGYHQSGWELGRYLETRRGNPDPGPYPGFLNRNSWSKPW